MLKTWNVVPIIDVNMHNIELHVWVKFEVSKTDIYK